MRFKKHKWLFFVVAFILLFSACKKYPENNLWLKNPARVIDGNWNLTFFEINGNDSLNHNVDLIKNKKITFSMDGKQKLYTKSRGGSIEIKEDSNFAGSWYLDKTRKHISIYFGSEKYEYYAADINCVCYNFNVIFVKFNIRLNWDIQKLTKTDFWITTNYNGLKYELHFKK